MNHQLVLQFQGDDDDTLDKVIALEDRLIEALDGSTTAEVDGHEPGEGVINLVLLAKNAAKVWEKIEPIVEDASDELDINAVAFRALNTEEFTVLWPVDSCEASLRHSLTSLFWAAFRLPCAAEAALATCLLRVAPS